MLVLNINFKTCCSLLQFSHSPHADIQTSMIPSVILHLYNSTRNKKLILSNVYILYTILCLFLLSQREYFQLPNTSTLESTVSFSESVCFERIIWFTDSLIKTVNLSPHSYWCKDVIIRVIVKSPSLLHRFTSLVWQHTPL